MIVIIDSPNIEMISDIALQVWLWLAKIMRKVLYLVTTSL